MQKQRAFQRQFYRLDSNSSLHALTSRKHHREQSHIASREARLSQEQSARRILHSIRNSAKSTINTNQVIRAEDLTKNRHVFRVADQLADLHLGPHMADKVMDRICSRVGLSPLESDKTAKSIDHDAFLEILRGRKKELGQNMVVLQPTETLEDKPGGLFNQALLQFSVFDYNLSPRRQTKPKVDLETRKSVSGVKLTENLSNESPFLRHVQKGECLAHLKHQPNRLHPQSQSVSMEEDAHLVTLRNITRQMREQNQDSKHISQ